MLKIKNFTLLIITLVMLFVVSGCSKNANDEIVGKWVPTTASLNGKTVNYSELDIEYDQFEFEFKSDGKCIATLAGISGNGSYTFNGTSVDVEINNEIQKLDYDNGTLTLALNYGSNTTMFTFTKSNEE